jgi:hypothetical protein
MPCMDASDRAVRDTRLRTWRPRSLSARRRSAVRTEECARVVLVETITAVVGAAAGIVCAIPVVIKWIRRR